jgi:hypothetical protein
VQGYIVQLEMEGNFPIRLFGAPGQQIVGFSNNLCSWFRHILVHFLFPFLNLRFDDSEQVSSACRWFNTT